MVTASTSRRSALARSRRSTAGWEFRTRRISHESSTGWFAFLGQGHRRVIYLETNALAPGPGTVPSIIESEGDRLTERTGFGASADAYPFEIVEPE
jgi:hypothetical protein